MRKLRDLMTLPSHFRYLTWRALGFPPRVTVKLRSGERLLIRPKPACDLNITREVFVSEIYHPTRPIPPDSVDLVVDVGANVGYSVVYFANRYRRARIEAFEPHPVHVDLLRRNLDLNGITERVAVHPVAAGITHSKAWLSDKGGDSQVSTGESEGMLPITVVDFFDAMKNRKIDLLKIDCEGGEYPLIMDSRFPMLHVERIIMEWHSTQANPHADQDLCERLRSLGWEIDMVWEDRNPSPPVEFVSIGVFCAHHSAAIS